MIILWMIVNKTLMVAHIQTFQGSISVSQRQQNVEQVMNTQIYKFIVQYTKNILQNTVSKSFDVLLTVNLYIIS
jgi:hypothetical protein